MTTKNKRQIWKTGAFVKLSLGTTQHTYARLLESPFVAFYDLFSPDDMRIEDIRTRRVVFIIAVMRYAVTSGRWIKIGSEPLEEHLKAQPVFFVQVTMHPGTFSQFKIKESMQ